MNAPLCEVHGVPMRQGKPGTPWEDTWHCTEWLGKGVEGANQNGYCDQRAGSPRPSSGRPPQRSQGRPGGSSPPPRTSSPVAASPVNLRAVAMESASRVFTGAGANGDTWLGLSGLADQIHGWLTGQVPDDGGPWG